MGIRLLEPGQVKFSRVMLNRLCAVPHLLNDVIDDGALHQDDRARFNGAGKSATGAKIDQQVWFESDQ